jgi:TRAP-type C4-dicarboxylate transport system substrate-binding protein
MKNKILLISLVVMLTTGLILAACAKPTPTSTPTAASTPTPSTVPPKVIELNYAIGSSPQSPAGKLKQSWADLIGERTGGRVKINCYFGESLVKFSETLRGVQTGIADIAEYTYGAETSDLFGLTRLMDLHFMNWPGTREEAKIYEQLCDKYPAIRQQWTDAGIMIYAFTSMPGAQLHTTNKAVSVPKDLNGMKIISTGGIFDDAIKQGGGAPLDIFITDYYSSLEKGLAQGVVTNYSALLAFKLVQLLPYHTNFGEGGICYQGKPFIINLEKWNSLPSDIQKMFRDIEAQLVEDQLTGYDGEQAAAIGQGKQANQTYTSLSPEEFKLWSDIYQSEHQQWIDKNTAQGYPAKQIYEDVQQLIKGYAK